MMDPIQTKTKQTIGNEKSILRLGHIPFYIKKSYEYCIQSTLAIKNCLEPFLGGIPVGSCVKKKNVLKAPYSPSANGFKRNTLIHNLEEDCLITDMAKKVGLSRIRFYQLRKEGVFPEPDYSSSTNRSFYTLKTQQRCLEIRKTGIGLNGKRIYFNTPRQNKTKKSRTSRNRQNTRYEKLAAILRQWRWDVTSIDVETVVNDIYPEGLQQHPDDGRVLRDVIDYYKKKDQKQKIEQLNDR